MTPFAMNPKNGAHDVKRWCFGINSFLTGPVIVSNKNWNIPIKWTSRNCIFKFCHYIPEREFFLSSFSVMR